MKKQSDLILDDIYNSPDPEVKKYISKVFAEECNKKYPQDVVFERAIIRVAWKFKHLLSLEMQKVLEAEYPKLNNL